MKSFLQMKLGMAAVALLAGCAVQTEQTEAGEGTRATAQALDDTNANLLAGPWQFDSADLTMSGDLASTYTVAGDAIDLRFAGVYYHWSGTTYRGYSFTQEAPVQQGHTYDLALPVSGENGGAPAFFAVTLPGAGPVQYTQLYSDGTAHVKVTVTDDPGASPTITLTAHPLTATFGPIQGFGMGLFSYTVSASLTEVP